MPEHHQENHLFLQAMQVQEGEILYDMNEARDTAYLIELGHILLTDSNNQTINAKAGEIIGEQALIEGGGDRQYRAVAVTDSVVYVITRDVIKKRITSSDPLVAGVMQLFSEKLNIDMTDGHGLTAHTEDKFLNDLRMEQELRKAIQWKQFEPYLQPIVELSEGRIIGFETLIRWNHPDKGIIMPDQFIPIAERTNVVCEIDRCMLEASCHLVPEMLAALPEGHKRHIFVSVNLSGRHFDSESVVDMVRNAIDDAQIDPTHIKLEITETALIDHDDQKTIDILNALHDIGVTIALDDFGTGYSSLGYLHRLAIDALKIDRSFVRELTEDPRSESILNAIFGLAEQLELKVIAEGIETSNDLKALEKMGCLVGQGYHFSKPMTAFYAVEALATT